MAVVAGSKLPSVATKPRRDREEEVMVWPDLVFAEFVAAVLFIGLFMRWLGKYPWWKVAAVSLGTAVVFFLIFERWFLVPLPKGPVETLLGFN